LRLPAPKPCGGDSQDGILVSDVVKEMVMGKDFAFTDHGELNLKGFDEPVRVWAVTWET